MERSKLRPQAVLWWRRRPPPPAGLETPEWEELSSPTIMRRRRWSSSGSARPRQATCTARAPRSNRGRDISHRKTGRAGQPMLVRRRAIFSVAKSTSISALTLTVRATRVSTGIAVTRPASEEVDFFRVRWRIADGIFVPGVEVNWRAPPPPPPPRPPRPARPPASASSEYRYRLFWPPTDAPKRSDFPSGLMVTLLTERPTGRKEIRPHECLRRRSLPASPEAFLLEAAPRAATSRRFGFEQVLEGLLGEFRGRRNQVDAGDFGSLGALAGLIKDVCSIGAPTQ